MKYKVITGIMLTLLLIGMLTLILNLQPNSVWVAIYSGQSTEVSGYISENTTWTLAGSPYIVVGDVIVESGVFLTIELGVVVKFTSGTNLIIDGSLIAQGNSTHKITFTSNATTPALGDWGRINIRTGGSYKEVKWVRVEYSTDGIKGLANSNVTQSVFDRNGAGVSGSNIVVAESNFTRNTAGIAGSYPGGGNITDCLFEENDYGVWQGKNLNIIQCSFTRNGKAFDNFLSGVIRDCQVYNNTIGIETNALLDSSVQILGCQVINNENTGIYVSEYDTLIKDTNVTDNGGHGIAAFMDWYWGRGRYIENSSILNNGGDGVSAGCNGIYNSTVSGNGGGGVTYLFGTMSHCNISHNSGIGVKAFWESGLIEYSEISGNLFGIEIDINGDSSTCLALSHSRVCNNLEGGIRATAGHDFSRGGAIRVHDSIIDSNGKFGIKMNTTAWGGTANLPIHEVFDSTISNHTVGLVGCLGVVSNSTINNNSQIGLNVFSGCGLTTTIHWSNIYNNSLYNIKNHFPYGQDVNATNNWWGTTNETLIEELIHDYYDNYTLSRVLYEPYLTEPWPPTAENRPPTIDSFSPVDTTPEVSEGDSLDFTQTSSDPDNDTLTYSWLLDSVEQTTTQNWTYLPDYDAAGTHNVALVVSDGELTDSQEWNVTVINVNRPPTIDSHYPPTDPIISEGESQEFNITYSDLDGDMVSVQWYLDGTPTATSDSYTFVANYGSAGTYNVTVIISDGFAQALHEWMLTVLLRVKIVEVIPCDAVGNPKNTFETGTLAYFKVVVNNTGLEPVNVLITFNIYDSNGNTIGVASFQGPVMPGVTTLILGLPIPTTSNLGEATVYASAFTDWIHNGGVPYCPEMSSTFEIL